MVQEVKTGSTDSLRTTQLTQCLNIKHSYMLTYKHVADTELRTFPLRNPPLSRRFQGGYWVRLPLKRALEEVVK